MIRKLNREIPRKGKTVVWMSAGVSSFIAGWLYEQAGGPVDEWIYIHVNDQHPDSLRFVRDCGLFLGREIKVLQSDRYKCVEDVIRDRKMINSPGGAPCTGMLKKAVRKKWENEQYAQGVTDFTYVWGMDLAERKRAENMRVNFPEFTHEFPLIDRCLTKNDCHVLIDKLGVKKPQMYLGFRGPGSGYQNNNCIGCVKGGMFYWNQIRKDFPEVFERRAKLEREIGHSCINGCFLDELNPNRGNPAEELGTSCSLACYATSMELGIL